MITECEVRDALKQFGLNKSPGLDGLPYEVYLRLPQPGYRECEEGGWRDREDSSFDKSEGLRLGAWRGSNTLPEPFRWSDEPVCILGVWFGPDLELKRNWSEVQVKVNAQVGT